MASLPIASPRSAVLWIALSAMIIALCQSGRAQQQGFLVVEGYVTAAHMPEGFDVDGTHVRVASDTGYGRIGDQQTSTDNPLRRAIDLGAYVRVEGPLDTHRNTADARRVFVRDDANQKIEGVGVIYGVSSDGTDPVFLVDGYRIRIASSTQLSFEGGLKSLGEIETNLWMNYAGRRDQNGDLVARTARFLPAKPSKVKALPVFEMHDWHVQTPAPQGAPVPTPPNPGERVADDRAGVLRDGKVKLGRWHTLPGDSRLQSRIAQIGMRVVPAYQKEMLPSDPAKIDFRFYAVDAKNIRAEVCSYQGLILIPVQLVNRMQSDDQIAALLADGVAYNLQRQAARTVANNRAFWGLSAAGEMAGFFVPGVGIATQVGASLADKKIRTAMEEQRARVALALLAGAGYDPWQSPEAWRLAAPKQVPKDINLLKYPSLSGYQLSILALQYKKVASTPARETGR